MFESTIEIRIVEILKDNMGKREVVNDDDIEKVIAQIGKPEVIEEQEEAYFSDKTANKNQDLHFLRHSKNNCSVTQKI